MQTSQKKVINYFNNLESRLGYALLLKGTKHFGYYPKGKEYLSISSAQRLMEDKLAESLNLKKDSHVLDAGCGEGFAASHLAKEYGLRVTGVDLLDWAIKNGRINAKKLKVEELINLSVMDYTKLSFTNNYFDGVYTMETFIHSPDYKQGLQEFYRVLKPKGKLVMFEYSMCPLTDLTTEQKRIAELIIKVTAMHSLPSFLHDKFPQLLTEAGFKNVQVENITDRILPMMRKFYLWAYFPYQIIRLLKLQKYFINTTSAYEGYKNITLKHLDSWRYNIITATKE